MNLYTTQKKPTANAVAERVHVTSQQNNCRLLQLGIYFVDSWATYLNGKFFMPFMLQGYKCNVGISCDRLKHKDNLFWARREN